MTERKVKLYLARGMTGLVASEVVAQAENDKTFFEAAGFEVLCPVSAEKVRPTSSAIQSTKAQMDEYWYRDKEMIREADIVVDMTPERKSEGVAHEIGYARYFLWRPVVRLYKEGGLPSRASVAYFEDDCLVDSREFAVEYIYRVHGTLIKRLKWRFNLYRRCLLKAIKYQIQGWK